MNYKQISYFLIFLFCWSFPVFGEQHALLIGVSKYPKLLLSGQLEGPAYDVEALEKVLADSLGFARQNIKKLVDTDATKDAILGAMKNLKYRSKPGDFIFLYFSGHGTSAYDQETGGLGIEPHTGALVPSDFDLGKTEEQMFDSLIIGKRDIKPILMSLEKDRRIFAAFDSCYSGQAVRGRIFEMHGKPKFLRIPVPIISSSVRGKSMAGDLFDDEKPTQWIAPEKPSYPYKNTIYLSAASENQQAMDIPSSDIPSKFETIDNKPHGAMTDALLRAMRGDGDSNADGRTTYRELHQFVQAKVVKEHPHTPQMLSPKNNESMKDETVFLTRSASHIPGPKPKINKKIKVCLKDKALRLKSQIAAIPDIEIVDKGYDLLVTGRQSQGVRPMLRIYLANDTLLAQMESDKVVERIKKQIEIQSLTAFTYPKQSFNVFVEVIDNKSILIEGSTVGFEVKADIPSYLLLINIETTGQVNVLYPGEANELGKTKKIHKPNLGIVAGGNYGTEFIKAFAFKTKPASLESFMKAQFKPDDPKFDKLMQIVKNAKDAAQATIKVETAAKKDVEQ